MEDCCDFISGCELSQHPEVKRLETSVLGCDYGGTSWTTRDQVDDLVGSLELDADSNLLEIGAGSGWPGLLVGQLSGCLVTFLDIPLNGLAYARQRADTDGLAARVHLVCGSGTALPLPDEAFDKVSHSDVLCCLPDKAEMLRECRRVANAAARMHFAVLLPAPGISQAALTEVIEVGPPFVTTDGDYAHLLTAAGWCLERRETVSHEFLASLESLSTGLEAESELFATVMGPDVFEGQLEKRKRQAEAVRRGWLVREVFLASAC